MAKPKVTGILFKPTLRTGVQINPPARQPLAAGFWGPQAKARMQADQTVERIIKSTSDWVGLGVVVDAWVPAVLNTDKLPVCSCVKTTTGSADIRCLKCYGTKLIPGFVKWGFNTCFFSAVGLGLTGQGDSGYGVPAGFVKDTTTTQHTLMLAPGVISSQFETPDFAVDNPYSGSFEIEVEVYNRSAGNSNLIEWSFDRGSTWVSGDFTQLRLARGTVRFRITLARQLATQQSPRFEILRFRYPIQDQPYFRVARPTGNRRRKREEWGISEDESGLKFIATPLSGSARINGLTVYDAPWLPDNLFFFEIKEGTFAGDRYFMINYDRNEIIGVLTSQSVSVRRVIPDEVYKSVF